MKQLSLAAVLCLLAALALPPSRAQQPVKVQAPVKSKEPPPLVTPRMAVEFTHDDAAAVGICPHNFYVFDPEPSDLRWDAVDYAINTALSHSANLYRSPRVADGRALRVDKRELCPNPK